MKRELAFVLQTQCDLPTGLSEGRTRASKGRILSNDGAPVGGSRKKLKAGSNGAVTIDVGREEKVTADQCSDLVVGVYRRTRRFSKGAVINDKSKCISDEQPYVSEGSSEVVRMVGATVIVEESKCNLDEGSSKEELRDGSKKPHVSEGGSEVIPMAGETIIIEEPKCNVDEGLSKEELWDGREQPYAGGGGPEVGPTAGETVIVDESKCNLDEDSLKGELRGGCEKPYASEGGFGVLPMAGETVIIGETKCNLDEGLTKEEMRGGIKKPCVGEGGTEVAPMAVDESNEVNNAESNDTVEINDLASDEVAYCVNNEVLVETPRRLTRSRMNAGGSTSENGRVLNAKANAGSLDCATGTETKKLELKMSKKIGLQSRPTTTKELLSTGLLEGLPVFYNGGTKHKAAVLRGTIKDVGILCFCSLCKGSRVVSPGLFEIHACKLYRRAAQYICLENGRNLLEVVKACRNSRLNTLEDTIHNLIGPLPTKESISCHDCKRSFLATTAKNVELLCPSCIGLKNSEPAVAETTDSNARSLQPTLPLRRSTRSASVIIPLEDDNQESVVKDRSLNQALSPMSPGIPFMHTLSHKKKRGRKKKNSSGSPSVSQPNASTSVLSSSKTIREGKTTKKVLKPGSARKANRSALVWISSQHQSQSNITKKSTKAILSPRSSKSASLNLSPGDKNKWKITKKDQGLHKLVFEHGGLPDGTEVAYYSRGQKLLEGYKKGPGIFCRCCSSEVSASQFEAHAGWASRKKPYQYIYTSNGVSLHEFAISLLKGRKHSEMDNDDLCIICADGGKLLLCDVCPRAFHIECASLTSIPRGKWYCQYCQNMFQREKFVECNENALAAGRVCGVDPIDQITRRCIRIVKNPEDAEVIACVLCRGYNFRKSGFGSFTVIVCDQCEKEYHVGCLKKHNMADLQELPKGKWFCCMDCEKIFSALQKLLIRGEEKIPESLLDVMKKKHEEKVPDTPADFDVRWRVLSGKIATPETRVFLSKAVAIFHDCFDPIVDSATGRDFIPSMVYGRNIRGQDFAGMYCALLTLNSRVVSAGIFRVFGQEIAELPLVATSSNSQGKGYFQVLFSCIEKLLASLNVKWLVLPAAHEAESIWTQKFGFERIPVEQLSNFRKTCWQMLTFTGTDMLQKMVPPCRIIDQLVDDVAISVE